MADLTEAFDDVALTVCIEHGSFVPCRRKGGCHLSRNPVWVARVREYHATDGATWEPASERVHSAPDDL